MIRTFANKETEKGSTVLQLINNTEFVSSAEHQVIFIMLRSSITTRKEKKKLWQKIQFLQRR